LTTSSFFSFFKKIKVLSVGLLLLLGTMALGQLSNTSFWKRNAPLSPFLSYSTSAQSLTAAFCSGIVTVETKNAAGVVTPVGSNLTVNLSGPSLFTFYSDSNCLNIITSTTILTGNSSASFYFTAASSGTPAFTAAAASYTSANQTATVAANAFVWTGGGGDANWTTGANWSGGAAPSTTSHTAFFDVCSSNCSPSINTNISIKGIQINASFTGTLNQATTRTITLAGDGWLQKGGTFAGGDSAMTLTGPLLLQGGTFTATSNTLSINSSAAFTISGTPIFNHNAGTVSLSAGNTVTPGTAVFNHAIFNGSNWSTFTISGTMSVQGNLTLNNTTYNTGAIVGGTIEIAGNLNISNYGLGGSTLLKLVGNSNQTITGTGTGPQAPSLEIASTGGTVTLVGDIRVKNNYTFTSGTLNAGTSSLSIWGSAHKFGTEIYHDVTVNGIDWVTTTMTGNLKVAGTLTIYGYAANSTLAGDPIEASGNVVVSAYGMAGSSFVRLVGSGNQTLTGTGVSPKIPSLEIASTGGTVTYAGTIYVMKDYLYTSGTVDAGTSTLIFKKGSLTPGPIVHNNVTFSGYNSVYTLTGTLTVNGTLNFGDTYSSGGNAINSGAIIANGDVVASNYGYPGTTTLTLGGASNTSLTVGATAKVMNAGIVIAKTGGASVSLASAASFGTVNQDIIVSSGTLNLVSYALTVNRNLQIDVGAKLICGTGTFSAATYTFNGEVVCGNSVGITWTGSTGDNTWSTAGNWSGGIMPTASEVAIFNSACVGANCNANITANMSVKGVSILSSYTGTITQNSTRTITLGAAGWNQAGGTFAGGDSTITSSGAFALTAGTFTSTSGTFTPSGNFTVSGSPIFNHNAGTLNFTANAITITPASVIYNNVIFAGSASTQTLSGTFKVAGTLTLADTHPSSGYVNGGTIEASGNVNASSIGKYGTTLLKLVGSSNQTVTGISTANILPFEIASTGGTVTYSGTLSFRSHYTYTSGVINVGTSNVTFYPPYGATANVIPGAVAYNDVNFSGHTSATINLTGTITVNGTLTLYSYSISYPAQIIGGIIQAKGNVESASYGMLGTVLLKISGSTNQTVTGVSTAHIPDLEIISTGGKVTFVGTLLLRSNFAYTSGVVDAGTSTVNFYPQYGATVNVIPGAVAYNHVNFSGSPSATINLTGTITVNGTLTLFSSSSSYPAQILGGIIQAKGNVDNTSYGMLGTVLLSVSGSTNQTVTGVSTAHIPNLEIVSTGGTVTFVGTLFLRSHYTYTSGVVDAGTSTVNFYTQYGAAANLSPGPVVYNDFSITGSASSIITLTGTITVNGLLTLNSSSSSYPAQLNGGNIQAKGNIVYSTVGIYGTTVMAIEGSTSTTLNVSSPTSHKLSTNVTINKSGGASLALLSQLNYSIAGQDLTLASGVLDLNGFDLTVNDTLTIASGATLRCNGGEYFPGTLANSGTLNCPGEVGYEYNWTGAGGNTNWSTAANWSGGAVPPSFAYVVFDNVNCGGTCSANLDTAVSVRGIDIKSGFSGTLTQSSGNAITVGTSGWKQAGGTFVGSDANINMSGNFSLSGGNFTSTSATLAVNIPSGGGSWTVSGGATFTHNSGTVTLYSGNATTFAFTPGTVAYNNLSLLGFANTHAITGTATVAGNLVFGHNSGSAGAINSGTINVSGNITVYNSGYGGNGLIRAVGSSSQTITGGSGGFPPLEIASTGGTVTITGTILTGTYLYTSGAVDASTSTMRFYGSTVSITPGPANYNDVIIQGSTSSNTITLTGTLNVLGTLSLIHNTASGGSLNSGTIVASGNVSISGSGNLVGTASLTFAGSSNTTLSSTGALKVPGATITIAKTAGASVTMQNAMLMNNTNQDLTITSGTLDMAGYALTVARNISNSGTLRRGTNPSCGAITQGGSYTGTAAVCP
jgi:fibronectin-binding autotransporter adhesin